MYLEKLMEIAKQTAYLTYDCDFVYHYGCILYDIQDDIILVGAAINDLGIDTLTLCYCPLLKCLTKCDKDKLNYETVLVFYYTDDPDFEDEYRLIELMVAFGLDHTKLITSCNIENISDKMRDYLDTRVMTNQIVDTNNETIDLSHLNLTPQQLKALRL